VLLTILAAVKRVQGPGTEAMMKMRGGGPVVVYRRSRVETVVVNVEGLSSGVVSLQLEKASTLRIELVQPEAGPDPEMGWLFVLAVDRVPSLEDFDVVMCGRATFGEVHFGGVSLRLCAGTPVLQWRKLSTSGAPMSFSNVGTRLVVAVDA
jgi:hypothetical protein